MSYLIKISLIIFVLFSNATFAQEYKNFEVEDLLNAKEAPSGVVFEIVTWEKDAWDWAAPMLKQYRKQLLEKYPGIDIALVSHGGEQFELTKDKVKTNAVTFKALKSLSDDGVDLHVCGTHSSWQNVEDSEYVDFIDVSPSGPAQINDYVALGFTHILLRAP